MEDDPVVHAHCEHCALSLSLSLSSFSIDHCRPPHWPLFSSLASQPLQGAHLGSTTDIPSNHHLQQCSPCHRNRRTSRKIRSRRSQRQCRNLSRPSRNHRLDLTPRAHNRPTNYVHVDRSAAMPAKVGANWRYRAKSPLFAKDVSLPSCLQHFKSLLEGWSGKRTREDEKEEKMVVKWEHAALNICGTSPCTLHFSTNLFVSFVSFSLSLSVSSYHY